MVQSRLSPFNNRSYNTGVATVKYFFYLFVDLATTKSSCSTAYIEFEKHSSLIVKTICQRVGWFKAFSGEAF